MDTLTTLHIDSTHPRLAAAGVCDDVEVSGFVVSEDEVEGLKVTGQLYAGGIDYFEIDLTDQLRDVAELALIDQAIRDDREEPSFRGDQVEPS
jgi:hypothetical protein